MQEFVENERTFAEICKFPEFSKVQRAGRQQNENDPPSPQSQADPSKAPMETVCEVAGLVATGEARVRPADKTHPEVTGPPVRVLGEN